MSTCAYDGINIGVHAYSCLPVYGCILPVRRELVLIMVVCGNLRPLLQLEGRKLRFIEHSECTELDPHRVIEF